MGEWLTKVSIWLVIACYGIVVATASQAHKKTFRLRRLAWALGGLAFAVHVVLAFSVFYQWDWAVAWRLTADQAEEFSGVRAGWGLWMNFAFGLAWILLGWREKRSKGGGAGCSWIDRILHGFVFFMVVMGGIVFAPWPARWFTSIVLVCAIVCGLVDLRTQRQPSTSPKSAPDHEN
jgi:hypothetical protein